MNPPPATVTSEQFETYLERVAYPNLPLAVMHQYFEAGPDTGVFRHDDFYALYVVESGRGLHVINGHPYAVTRGDVYMTPPGTTHQYRDYHGLRAEAFQFTASLFQADELEALRALSGFWDLFVAETRSPSSSDYRLHLSPERHEEVRRAIDEICVEWEQPAALAVPLVRALFFRLMVYLARRQAEWERGRHGSGGFQPPANAHGRGIADVLRFCERHYAEPLSVPQLAALMFLSAGHFSEVFAREVGVTPTAYVRRLRLERAQTLLRDGDRTATDIAHQVGFGDLAQLSRAFRAEFGSSPSEYRAKFGKSRQ